MSSEERFQRHLRVLTVLIIAAAVCVAGRLVQLEAIDADIYIARAEKQHSKIVKLEGHRGSILERNGRAIALSNDVDSVYVDPSQLTGLAGDDPTQLTDRAGVARALARVLSLDGAALLRRMEANSEFAWVKQKISPEERARLDAFSPLSFAVHYQRDTKRFYPRGEFASQLVGFVGNDGVGLEGIELDWDATMRSEGESFLLLRDGHQNVELRKVREEGRPGSSLELTIDERVQHAAEEALDGAMEKTRSLKGAIIVADPTTGEILAIASRPTYDPNDFRHADPVSRKNVAVGDRYEPGSTFKIITAAAGLEEGRVRPDEWFDCANGLLVVNGRKIHDVHPHGTMLFSDVIAKSSNIGIVRLGLRLGGATLESYVRKFGFGRRTGVGLSSEAEGMVHSRWKEDSLISVSMGQEILVTPLQMLQAFSAVANEGEMVTPSVVRAVVQPDGTRVAVPAGDRRRVVSARTARQLVMMMERVVDEGTGKAAAIPGYRVAGKTGTSQKIGADGRYSHTAHVASFVGFAPASAPRVAAIVMLDEPKGSFYYGGEIAAPCFAHVVGVALEQMRVAPDLEASPDGRMHPEQAQMARQSQPDLVQSFPSWERAVNRARALSVGTENASTAWSAARASRSGGVAPAGGSPDSAGPATPGGAGLGVAGVFGMSLRDATRRLSAQDLKIVVSGTGFVIRQTPPEGTLVRRGEICHLTLSPSAPVEDELVAADPGAPDAVAPRTFESQAPVESPRAGKTIPPPAGRKRAGRP